MNHTLPLFCLLALLLSAFTRVQASDTNWNSVAMGGGGFVSGILFHPTEKGLAYCRTDVGGIYRWDAPNNAWIALNDDLGQADSQLLGVTGIALDANNPDKVYIATGQYLQSWGHLGAIFRSSDRGATWARTNLGIRLGGNADGRSSDERLVVDPNLGSILFLASNQNGLWKSTDSGANWTQVSTFPLPAGDLPCIIFDKRSGTPGAATPVLYVGVNATIGTLLYQSTDGGNSWSATPGYPSTTLVPSHAAFDSAGLLYLTLTNNLGPNGASSGAVYKFNPSTRVWTNITPSNDTGSWGYSGLSLDRNTPGTLVVSTLDRWFPGHDEIYRSTDGGASWKGILNGASRDLSSGPWAIARTPHWVSDVEIDPTDSDRIFFNTGYGVFATSKATNANTGAGNTVPWFFYNRGLEEIVPLSLVSPTSGPLLVSAVGDVAGFRHDSLSTAPAKIHTAASGTLGTCESVDVAELAPAKLVLTGYIGSTQTGFYSTDGAASWTQFANKPTFPAGDAGRIAINADGSRIIWSPKSMVPQYSTDNGSTWNASTGTASVSGAILLPVTDKVKPLKAYLFNTSSGRLIASADGGVTWSALNTTTLPSGSAKLRATPANEGHLWLASWNSGLYRSTDGGLTWARLSTATNAYNVALGAKAPDSNYPTLFLWGIVSGVEGVFRSVDQGSTWTRVDDEQHRYGYINEMAADARTYGRVYLATGGRGIAYGELNTKPIFSLQPAGQGIATGGTARLSAEASNVSTWQWYRNGTALSGQTSSSLLLANFSAADAGDYTVLASSSTHLSTLSALATLTPATSIENRIVNISTRSAIGLTGLGGVSNPLTGGFFIAGSQHKTILIRAAGPCLRGSPFYITDGLPDPVLKVYDTSGNVLATNDNWADTDANASAVEAAAATTYAFMINWTRGSKDAAIVLTLPPGGYTAEIRSKTPGVIGTCLIEIYDADSGPTASQLVNISTQSDANNTQAQVAGFYVRGNSRRVLVRAAGPALGKFGISPILANPKVVLQTTSDGKEIASNDNWGTDATVRAALRLAFVATGAFDLINGSYIWADASTDAALVAQLPVSASGSTGYTASVSGDSTTSGRCIVEVYDYP